MMSVQTQKGWKGTNGGDELRQHIPQDAERYIKELWLFPKKRKENISEAVDRFSLRGVHASYAVERSRARREPGEKCPYDNLEGIRCATELREWQ